MTSPFLSSKSQLTHYNLKVQKYSFSTPNLISPFQTGSEPASPRPLLPYHSGSTQKLKPSFVLHLNEMGEIDGVPCWAAALCMHCSSKSLLIYIYVRIGSCMLNFYAASKCFAAFLSKIWVVSLHYVCSYVKLYMELVYPLIDYCSVCSSGAASSK